MNNTTPRIRYNTVTGFQPAQLRAALEISIAEDNVVCVECAKPLGDEPYQIVSSPKRKGILAFCCERHTSEAMNRIARAIEGLPKVPLNLQTPRLEDADP